MKKLGITMGIVAFLLVGTLTFIGYRYSQSVKGYKALEADLKESASVYMGLSDLKLTYGEQIKIDSKTLLENKYIDSMNVKEDTCKGYVIAKKTNKSYEYTAYIKCNDYTTKDYEK